MFKLMLDKRYLPLRILVGFLIGIVAGIFFYDFSIWIKPLGTLFMNLIKMLIVPVIFFSVASGIAAIGDVNKLKRIGTKVVVVYVVMTVVACLIGIAVVNLIHPGVGFVFDGVEAFDASKLTTPSFANFLFDLVPSNFVEAMAKGDIMQIIFFVGLSNILEPEFIKLLNPPL